MEVVREVNGAAVEIPMPVRINLRAQRNRVRRVVWEPFAIVWMDAPEVEELGAAGDLERRVDRVTFDRVGLLRPRSV